MKYENFDKAILLKKQIEKRLEKLAEMESIKDVGGIEIFEERTTKSVSVSHDDFLSPDEHTKRFNDFIIAEIYYLNEDRKRLLRDLSGL